ncbi:MAG: hypothetical protein U0M66_03535 [Bacilli bacterium]|nr:hypothetical protein [Bacilli bacterium]
MQSRMDKYQTSDRKKYERTQKNTKLYEEVYDDIYRDTTYRNMKVIDSAKEININKLKDMLDERYDTRQYRTLRNYQGDDALLDEYEKPSFNRKRQRVYDINEIISDAKSKRAFIEEAKEKQKYMDFTERRNRRYDERYEAMEKEEAELEELINTMAISNQEVKEDDDLDLLSDLKGDDNTIVTNPIEASFDVTKPMLDSTTKNLEKTLVKADKTFYTDSNMFTKNDFEDFSTLTRQLSKSNRFKKILIIFIIIGIIALLSYFVVTKFIIK